MLVNFVCCLAIILCTVDKSRFGNSRLRIPLCIGRLTSVEVREGESLAWMLERCIFCGHVRLSARGGGFRARTRQEVIFSV